MLPVAILCGGYGTRSRQPINKCFVPIGGKPFILRTMEMLEEEGFSTFVLCRGTDGTLTALRNAQDQLGDKFLMLYGDTFLRMSYSDFVTSWEKARTPGAMATYDKIDAGVHGVTSWMLDMVDEDVTDFAVLRDEARARAMIHMYQAPQSWLEVGSPSALATTKEAFSAEDFDNGLPRLRGWPLNEPMRGDGD